MSIFFTDPFTDIDNDPWDTGKWTVTTNVDGGATAVASIQLNHGRLRTTGDGTGIRPNMRVVAVNGGHTDIDLLITGLTYTGPTNQRNFALFVRGAGDWGGQGSEVLPTAGYRLLMVASGAVQLHRMDLAGEASLATATTWVPTQNNNIRIRMVGSTIEATIWQEGTTEPGTPTISGTDATYASGTIQMSAWSFSANTTTTDYLFDQIDADDLTVPLVELTPSPGVALGISSGQTVDVEITVAPFAAIALGIGPQATAAIDAAIAGTLDATQAANTADVAGSFGPSGTLDAIQADQTAAVTGTFGPTGQLAVTQAEDTLAAAGTVANPVTGTLAAVQADQTASFLGGLFEILGRTLGQFQRLGSTRLHISRIGRGGRAGFKISDEDWERVSDIFVFDDLMVSVASQDQAMASVAAAWDAHAGSDAATLKTAVHSDLDAAGFRRPDGSRLI